MSATLVVRLDNIGDVVLAGPAVRAVAARRGPVAMLCGRRGSAAAHLLPGVSEVIEWTAPWIDPDPEPVETTSILSLISLVRNRFAEALILTSFHQSALPLALLLRMAGIGRIAAASEDYPGSLLDVRHDPAAGLHEVERSLELAATLGYRLPAGDDGALRLREVDRAPVDVPAEPYVVVHPGASVPARTLDPDTWRQAAAKIAATGRAVVVTGSAAERRMCAGVTAGAGVAGWNLAGRTDLPGLLAVLRNAEALAVGNTGPAHLAAAVGTPVVSVFPPTVPAERWRPWRVPHIVLGDQHVGCAGCRARVCPVPGVPCLAGVRADMIVDAVERLTNGDRTTAAAVAR
jgi:ADP-heptose:LPS heptosyltransferase